MHVREKDWSFGSRSASAAVRAWWASHEPAVDEWLSEMEQAGDEWWQSAEHAAHCLVSYREHVAELRGGEPSWEDLDVGDFLFHDLWEGGTVGMFGSAPIFFDHLVEAMRRFGRAGVVEKERADRWVAEMEAARDDFVRCYDEETPEEESIAIAGRHRGDVRY